MNTFKKYLSRAAVWTAACILSACGGGGGGSASDGGGGSSALSLTPQSVKTFHFSWAAVAGATGYVLLEDPDGQSGYTAVAHLPASTSTYDHEVFLPARVNARYALQTCNANGCANRASVDVAGNLAGAAGYVKASAQMQNGAFGARVAISGDGKTLAVGASGDGSNATGTTGAPDPLNHNAPNSGAVYVFARSGSTWVQQAYIKASNHDAGDLFGDHVALSANGNVLAVSAVGEDGRSNGVANPDPVDNTAPNAGAAYVFRRSGAAWSQEAYVKASNGEAGDAFGSGLALSGDGATLAVGAPSEESNATGVNGNQNTNNGPDFGAVYVFVYNGVAWPQQAYVKASNAGTGDQFGVSVALSSDGNAMAVGAWHESGNATGLSGVQTNNSSADSGAVYTFARQGSTWAQQAYVKAPNTDANDQFGGSVALGGGTGGSPLTLAVGAVNEASKATGINGNQADNSAAGSGAVYLY